MPFNELWLRQKKVLKKEQERQQMFGTQALGECYVISPRGCKSSHHRKGRQQTKGTISLVWLAAAMCLYYWTSLPLPWRLWSTYPPRRGEGPHDNPALEVSCASWLLCPPPRCEGATTVTASSHTCCHEFSARMISLPGSTIFELTWTCPPSVGLLPGLWSRWGKK